MDAAPAGARHSRRHRALAATCARRSKGPQHQAPPQAAPGLPALGRPDRHCRRREIHSDPKKGDFYVARIVEAGRAAEEIIAELVPAVIRGFPWPKSMRWGAKAVGSKRRDSLRWVRPLQSIVCTFGPETEEPVVVDFEVDGIRSGNVTYGHRFHAPARDHRAPLRRLCGEAGGGEGRHRRRPAQADHPRRCQNLAFANGLELVEDEGLLEEVSGLVEWPVVLMGEFEEDFLDIPAEVIRLTIRANQKCFVTRGPRALGGHRAAGAVQPLHPDRQYRGEGRRQGDRPRQRQGGAGAPLRCALFLEDRPGRPARPRPAGRLGREVRPDDLGRMPLDQRMARLDHLGVTFHAKLGTQGERVERIARLAEELRRSLSGQPNFVRGKHLSGATISRGSRRLQLARRAAVLAKADLTTEVVGEFPELQGAMGRKYALLQGEHASVAAAIEEHYKPQGPSDRVPTDPVSVAVALADKLDTLVGFWAIDEKPTGSKDPFALRRAALGVIRIVLENAVRLRLRQSFAEANHIRTTGTLSDFADNDNWQFDLLAFFHDRLKVYLRDKGARHDLIDAVLASGGPIRLGVHARRRRQIFARATVGDAPGEGRQRRPLMIVRRVEALGSFLDTEDGRNLLAGTKRAANILAAEEKKGTAIAASVDPALFRTRTRKRSTPR